MLWLTQMTPMPFGQMIRWILKEKKEQGTQLVFIIPTVWPTAVRFSDEAGDPRQLLQNSTAQLTQNIAASYYGRQPFFELKTVQILDGEGIPVTVVSRQITNATTVSGLRSFIIPRWRLSTSKPGFY